MKNRLFIWQRLVLISFVLPLAGCAHFQSQPISSLETISTFEARSLDNPDFKKFLKENLHEEIILGPPAEWDFTKLTLAALYYHPDMYRAQARWATTKAAIISAGARPNPTVGFTPQFDANVVSGISPWTYGFTFDFPIETAGKRGRRIAQAKNLSEVARLNIVAAAWQVRSRLRTSLLDFYSATQAEEILKKQQVTQEETVRLLEERQSMGGVSVLDRTQAYISLQQINLSLRETQKQKAQARVRLADALGLPVAALEGVKISFEFLVRPLQASNLDLRELRRKVLTHRPDILGVLAEYTASESSLQLEIAKQYPNIHLGPGYQWDQGENKWSLGINVALPLLNQNQGHIAEAKARREEVRVKFIALQSKVIADLDSAFVGYNLSLKKLDEADSLMFAAKKKYRSLQAMLKTGEAARFALLNAEFEFDSALLSRLNALTEAQQSLGTLEDALQVPFDSVTKEEK